MMNQELENEVVKWRQKKTAEDKQGLEALVDSYTLAGVLDMLWVMCVEKAEHIRREQAEHICGDMDEQWAEKWEQAGNQLGLLSQQRVIKGVS